MGGRRLPAILLWLAMAGPIAAADAGCLLCHSFPLTRAGAPAGRSLQVLDAARAGTGHAGLGCRACHAWVTTVPHGAPSAASPCAGPCHAAVAEALAGSVHGEGRAGAVACRGCHRTEAAAGSAAGGAMAWCLACHGEGVRWEGYLRSPHGRPFALGGPPAAGCPDCHTVHGVLPASDPASSVAPGKVANTCRGVSAPGKECHPGAGDSFAGLGGGHGSPDEAAAIRFPAIRRGAFLAGGLLILLAAVCLLPARGRR